MSPADNDSGLRPPEAFSQAMKDRLAMRLLMRPDRRDTGEVQPRTAEAREMSAKTPDEAAVRVEALVSALSEERLIVPVVVEADPEDPDHKPLDPSTSPLETIDGPDGLRVVAFTSADELKQWDPRGRPMAIKAYRVAVGALAGSGSGAILVDPASEYPVLIPRPAVHALASGDSWLPAWRDNELRQELTDLVRKVLPGAVSARVRPSASGGEMPWDGGVAVEIALDAAKLNIAASGADSGERILLGAAMRELGEYPRLRESAPRVELIPVPVELT